MSGLRRLFSCIGQAVLAQAPRALVGIIPFGEAIYDVAADSLKRLRTRPDAEVNAELAEAANTDASSARQEAEAVAAIVAAGQPEAVRVNLVSYLSLVPDAVRQSLRRPADPSGMTVPSP